MLGGQIIIAILAALVMVLAMTSGGVIVVALSAKRRERAAEQCAHEATTRIVLAESALRDLRARKSASVSKGNRTRAERQAEKRKAKLAEMEAAIALKRAGGQHSLPLDAAPGQTGDAA